MPKRMIDGEALWTSGKLKKVQTGFRAHYANWLPLAEANGVFEVDFDIIRSRVYPIIDPAMDASGVEVVYREFVRTGLIREWYEQEKRWAYFVGIDKPGRLPAEKHVSRYKHLPPNPPAYFPEETGSMPEGFGVGLDRLGVGLEGENMSLKSNITDKARIILGLRINPDDRSWPEITALSRAYGPDPVLSAFEEWAESRVGENLTYPLSKFIDQADGILRGTITLKAHPDAAQLINELGVISNGSVLFDQKQSQAIGKLLSDYSFSDIKLAFKEFFAALDDFSTKFASKKFVEQASQLLYVQKHRREQAEKQQTLIARISENERAAVEAELAESDRKRREEEELANSESTLD